MNWLASILYGIISGFAEILPISSSAHQILMQKLFGAEAGGLRNLLVHASILAVLLYCMRPVMVAINVRTEQRRNKKRRSPDLRLVRTAAVPLVLSFLLFRFAGGLGNNAVYLTLLFLVNGIILYIPSRMLSGNKDARAMSGWDALLIGFFGALGVVPGISRVGASLFAASARGADRQNALNWVLLLCIPALILLIVLDILAVFAGGFGVGSVAEMFKCILSVLGAGCGSYFGIMLMRFLSVKAGFTAFAYYSWGAALFSFVMYLVVV